MRSNGHPPIASFKPVFCFQYSTGESIKRSDTSSWSRQSFSFREVDLELEEPASPKVGCMGQIKKDKMGLSGTRGGTSHKFFKLKKMFSSKSLAQETKTSQRLAKKGEKVVGVLPIDPPLELDPPLPVTKHGIVRDGDAAVSLWKRRFGVQLEGIQVQKLPPSLNGTSSASV